MIRFDIIDKGVENLNQPNSLEMVNLLVDKYFGLVDEVLDGKEVSINPTVVFNVSVGVMQRKALLKKIKDKYARVCLFLVDDESELCEADVFGNSYHFNSSPAKSELKKGDGSAFGHDSVNIIIRFQPKKVLGKTGFGSMLTNREEEIMNLLTQGLLYKEIAKNMGISLQTVKSHLKHIYTKMQVGNRSEAIIKHLQPF